MGDDYVTLYDRKKNLILLPPGTKAVSELSDRDKTTFICPDGDLVEVNRRERKIRNISKGINLGNL